MTQTLYAVEAWEICGISAASVLHEAFAEFLLAQTSRATVKR